MVIIIHYLCQGYVFASVCLLVCFLARLLSCYLLTVWVLGQVIMDNDFWAFVFLCACTLQAINCSTVLHTIFVAIFLVSWFASCPLDSQSPVILILSILTGQAITLCTHVVLLAVLHPLSLTAIPRTFETEVSAAGCPSCGIKEVKTFGLLYPRKQIGLSSRQTVNVLGTKPVSQFVY